MLKRSLHLRPRQAMAAALAAALCHPGYAGELPLGPNETVCPNPAMSEATLDASAGNIAPLVTGTPLKPGGTVRTAGTNPKESQELSDEVLRVYKQPFQLRTGEGDVKGVVTQYIKRGTDQRCKCEWVVAVDPDSKGCIAWLRINNFSHPLDLPIVADYRDDLLGDIVSDIASRSTGEGTLFKFRLPKLICAKQTSRPLLLNTSIKRMVKSGSVQLQGPKGELSSPIPTFAPQP